MMLLSQVTPPFFSLSFFLVVLNIPLFLYGMKKQGGVFTFYAIYTVVVYSVSAWLITEKAEEICVALGEEFGSSGTKIGVKESYTDDGKTIVYFVLNRFQIGKMKKIVHEVD